MNTFNNYWQALAPNQKNKLAEEACTSKNYLDQINGGFRNAGAGLIRRLIKADPNITFEMFDDHPETEAS